MYYDFMIPIPKVKGKITFMKKGKITYIQLETGRVYYPEKKYTIPQRVTIGKRVSADSDQMYPNDRYQEFFPDAVMPEERPEAYRSCALRIGSYAVIRSVLSEYKLPEMLSGKAAEIPLYLEFPLAAVGIIPDHSLLNERCFMVLQNPDPSGPTSRCSGKLKNAGNTAFFIIMEIKIEMSSFGRISARSHFAL